MTTNKTYKFGVYTINMPFMPGVFMFKQESAMGKSRLGKMFKSMMIKDMPVACYTYRDLVEYRLTLEEYLKDRHIEVLLIDRYNLYYDKFHDTINKLVKSGCMVMIDLKNYQNKPEVIKNLDPELEDIQIEFGEREVNLTLVEGE